MERLYCLHTSFMILLVVSASAFQHNIKIGGDLVLGGHTLVMCNWSTSSAEKLRTVQIMSNPITGARPYYFMLDEHEKIYKGSQYHDRLTYLADISTKQFIMIISHLQCSDDRNYSCLYVYSNLLSDSSFLAVSVASLILKGRPKAPSIMITPPGYSVLNQIWEYEETVINVTCSANMGFPGNGKIEWKLYYPCEFKEIIDNDPRLLKMINVPLQPGDDSCIRRAEQTLKMSVTSSYQGLKIGCFVINEDFPRVAPTPDFCQNSSADLCNTSQTIWILPPGYSKSFLLGSTTDNGNEHTSQYGVVIIAAGFVGIAIGGLLAAVYTSSFIYHIYQTSTGTDAAIGSNSFENFPEIDIKKKVII